jgi:hypothetical protein
VPSRAALEMTAAGDAARRSDLAEGAGIPLQVPAHI